MTETTFKRVLTDDIQAATRARDEAASSSGIPNDLFLKLRNVGARARKNVLEGYQTAPSSFSRAQTTGSLFRPMNDIIREVYAQPQASASTSSGGSSVVRKRARSVSEQDDVEDDAEMSLDDNTDKVAPRATNLVDQSRPVKPLRAPSRAFLQTRSLPASAFTFSAANKPTRPSNIAPLEEEDWSESTKTSQTDDFEPAAFEPTEFEPIEFEPMSFN